MFCDTGYPIRRKQVFQTYFREWDIGTKMPFAVLSIGHVGLPTAPGLAEIGWEVIGADGTANVVERLQAG
jgi:UDP-N-acetyl-D-mannosaminuronate dehydrogenase